MSLCLQPLGPVPRETARVAPAAFPKGHPYLRSREELGPLFTDALFAPLFPRHGQPAEAPWRLTLVTLRQYAEDLSDREPAQALRSRIDWKFLLGLELEDAGFHFSVLQDFRDRLLAGGAEELLLGAVLECCRVKQLLSGRALQRSHSTHVLAKVRAPNRLELVGETLRAALDVLAVAHPEWLLAHTPAQWAEPYGERFEEARLPRREAERLRLAEQIGYDGHALLDALEAPEAPPGLLQLPLCRGCVGSGCSSTTARPCGCAGVARARGCRPQPFSWVRPTMWRPAAPGSAVPPGWATRCMRARAVRKIGRG